MKTVPCLTGLLALTALAAAFGASPAAAFNLCPSSSGAGLVNASPAWQQTWYGPTYAWNYVTVQTLGGTLYYDVQYDASGSCTSASCSGGLSLTGSVTCYRTGNLLVGITCGGPAPDCAYRITWN